MDQAINYIKNLKNHKILIGAIVAIIVIATGTATASHIHQNNIVGQAKVSFNGYNGSGTPEITNSTELYQKMFELLCKKEGIKKAIIENIASDIVNSNGATEILDTLSSDDKLKVEKVQREIASITFGFKGKNYNLKNGDKVTLEFESNNSDVPFKNTTKQITVHGLKKTIKHPTKKVFDKLAFKASGFNGKGQLLVSSKNSEMTDKQVEVTNNGHLKNGDSVKVKLPDSLFEDYTGKTEYVGSHTFNYKVSGLVESNSITNVDKIISATDAVTADYVKDQESLDDKYTSKFIGLYIIPYADDSQYDGFSSYGSDDDSDNTVSENVGIADDTNSNDTFTVVAIYTVTDEDDKDAEPENIEITATNLVLKDKKLNIDDKKMTADDNESSISDSLDVYERNLSITGMKLK